MRNSLDDMEPSYKEYLEAEGLLPSKVHQKKFSFTYNTELFEADQFLKDICEKIIYKLTKKALKERYWNELRKRYLERGRYYHNLIHIANVYKALTPVKNEIEDWGVLVLAVLYHDIVYDVQRHDNEEQSANVAKQVLSSLKINSIRIDRCYRHILATKHHHLSEDNDTNLLIDADLSVLGSEPKVYQNFSEAIRQEYSIFPDNVYNEGRAKVLRKFLEIPSIFKTEPFQNQYEKQARLNLERELAILVSKQ